MVYLSVSLGILHVNKKALIVYSLDNYYIGKNTIVYEQTKFVIGVNKIKIGLLSSFVKELVFSMKYKLACLFVFVHL